ncbi:PH domain-containing protein [Patescibacteria group bacterium]|nr:PH domain-containing protein [Patescibacteria group bacterium]
MPEIFNSSKASKAGTSAAKTPVRSDEAQHSEVEAVSDPAPVHRLTEEKRKAKHVDEYSSVMRKEKPSHRVFAAYAPKPENTRFDSQHADEQVLLLLRQSLITQIKYVFVILGLIFVPVLFNAVGMLDFLPARFQLIANLGWYLIVASYTLEVFLSWFYNVYIITDERIIDVDFHSILFKNVSYAKLDNIEDITATTAGFLGSVFDFGDIKIQTAGAVTQFEFASVPHPSRVVAFLNELLIEEEQEKLDKRAN